MISRKYYKDNKINFFTTIRQWQTFSVRNKSKITDDINQKFALELKTLKYLFDSLHWLPADIQEQIIKEFIDEVNVSRIEIAAKYLEIIQQNAKDECSQKYP